MSFIAVLFKVIPYLLPFIKEMLIGKKSWAKAFRENRKKTILAIAVIISVIFNVILMVKLGSLAFSYLELSRAHEALDIKYRALEKTSTIIVGPEKSTAPKVVEAEPIPHFDPAPLAPRPVTTKHKIDHTAEIKAEFERMRRLEAAQGK